MMAWPYRVTIGFNPFHAIPAAAEGMIWIKAINPRLRKYISMEDIDDTAPSATGHQRKAAKFRRLARQVSTDWVRRALLARAEQHDLWAQASEGGPIRQRRDGLPASTKA
jgi:hypothetical protein